MILFPPGKMLASTMRSLKNQYDRRFTPMLSQEQEMVFSRPSQANIPFMKRTMTLKNAQLFWLKILKTEARNCIKGIHVMDVRQRYQWNMVPKAAQRKGAGSFEMGDTLLSYMVLS